MLTYAQRWLGELYSKLYVMRGKEAFTFKDVSSHTSSEVMAKVALTRLRKAGVLYTFNPSGRRLYRIAEPEVLTFISAGRIRNLEKVKLEKVKLGRYGRLLGIVAAEIAAKYEGVRSLVLYGSVARGKARVDSDVDLLALLEREESFSKRLGWLANVELSPKVEEELEWLYAHGVDCHLSFFPMLIREVGRIPPYTSRHFRRPSTPPRRWNL